MNKLLIQELANKTSGRNNRNQNKSNNRDRNNKNKLDSKGYNTGYASRHSNDSLTLEEAANKKMHLTSDNSSRRKSRDYSSRNNNVRMTKNDENMVNDIIDGSRFNDSRRGRTYGGYKSSNNAAGRRSSAANAGYKFHNRPYSHNDFNDNNRPYQGERRRVNSSVKTGNIDSLSEIVNKTLGKR